MKASEQFHRFPLVPVVGLDLFFSDGVEEPKFDAEPQSQVEFTSRASSRLVLLWSDLFKLLTLCAAVTVTGVRQSYS